MSKKSKSSISQYQATALMCLVVASTIAAGSLFVGYLLGGGSEPQTHQHKEQLNETPANPTVNPTVLTGNSGALTPVVAESMVYPDVSDTGVNSSKSYDYCVLTGAVNPTPPTQVRITGEDSITIPIEVCAILAAHVFNLVGQELISIEDVLILE